MPIFIPQPHVMDGAPTWLKIGYAILLFGYAGFMFAGAFALNRRRKLPASPQQFIDDLGKKPDEPG